MKSKFIGWGIFAVIALSGIGVGWRFFSAGNGGFVKIPGLAADAGLWREAFPLQYDSWRATAAVDGAVGDGADGGVATPDPLVAILYAGCPEALPVRPRAGHADSLDAFRAAADDGTPAAELMFYSADAPLLLREFGPAEFYQKKWSQLSARVANPVSCLDCHDPKTMKLTVTRPYLAEAYAAVGGGDLRRVSNRELRSLSCAQCHAQYYLDRAADGGVRVKIPWGKNGYSVEAIERSYAAAGHVDFIHAVSRTPLLKARHPDFELASAGGHARRGLSCADCHMPQVAADGKNFSDHQTRRPLQNMATCLACHKEDAPTLEGMVERNKQNIAALRATAAELLARAHYEIRDAADHGAVDDELAAVRGLVRRAQWRWDFVASARGAAFHAPDEAARILREAASQAGEARELLKNIRAGHGRTGEVMVPGLPSTAAGQD